MAYLGKGRKGDLLALADDLNIRVSPDENLAGLKKAIRESAEYDEEFVRAAFQRIIDERITRDEEKRLEREREEKRLEREREEKRLEREREEKRLEREHEKEMQALKIRELEVTQGAAREQVMSNRGNTIQGDSLTGYLNLVKDQLPKAPNKTENWVFFFHQAEMIFEIYEVPEDYRGKIILHRLADFIRSLTNSLGIGELSKYESIKECILAENRLTPLQHKANLEKIEKQDNESYVQWAARIKTCLDYYLESRQVSTLQELKDLIVSDKMKDLLPGPVKSHILIKEGNDWLKPTELGQQIDLFAEVCPKNYLRQEGKRDFERKWKSSRDDVRSEAPVGDNRKSVSELKSVREFPSKKHENFRPRCFHCNNTGHYRKDCPKLKSFKPAPAGEKQIKQVALQVGVNALSPRWEIVSNIEGEDDLPLVELNVGGKKVEAIRDSGAQISVFRTDMLPPECQEGGTVNLAPAFGEVQRAKLVKIPISLWQNDSDPIRPEVKILAAATPKLNSSALITPAAYRMLVKQANIYQVGSQGMGKEKSRTLSNPEERSATSKETFSPPERESGREGNERCMGGETNSGEGSLESPSFPLDRLTGGREGSELISARDFEPGIEETDEISEAFGTKSDLAKLFRKQQRECPHLTRPWKEARENKNGYFVEDDLLYHQERKIEEKCVSEEEGKYKKISASGPSCEEQEKCVSEEEGKYKKISASGPSCEEQEKCASEEKGKDKKIRKTCARGKSRGLAFYRHKKRVLGKSGTQSVLPGGKGDKVKISNSSVGEGSWIRVPDMQGDSHELSRQGVNYDAIGKRNLFASKICRCEDVTRAGEVPLHLVYGRPPEGHLYKVE